jgi:hypothetical protein
VSAEQLRYMSNARVLFLHQQQLGIMSPLSVTVLDVYRGTYLSAHQHPRGDALHYATTLSKPMLNWFYADGDD